MKRARQSDPGPRFRELVLAHVCQQGLCFDQKRLAEWPSNIGLLMRSRRMTDTPASERVDHAWNRAQDKTARPRFRRSGNPVAPT